tara:strand:+ start:210 stop:686 length:477 start_codon:yes stop_codon:yes gene_type:complete
MNHCLLEVKVKQAPTLRYTQDNKTPIAEMEVLFEGLRSEDPPGVLKVVGWGNLAQQLQSSIQVNQKVLIEGRLRMNNVSRDDGSKEKKAEFTLSRLHPLTNETKKGKNDVNSLPTKDESQSPQTNAASNNEINSSNQSPNNPGWDSSPLIPDTDEIPF